MRLGKTTSPFFTIGNGALGNLGSGPLQLGKTVESGDWEKQGPFSGPGYIRRKNPERHENSKIDELFPLIYTTKRLLSIASL